MAESLLVGVWDKIKRAQEHVDELEKHLNAFFETEPYRVVRSENTETQEWQWRVEFSSEFEMPPQLSLTVGDAVHNMRTALDHLVGAAVRANGHSPTVHTMFPICRRDTKPSTAALKSLVRGKVKGASIDFVKALGRYEPYLGGDHQYLWELNYLDNVDKHRQLLFVCTSNQSVVFDPSALMKSMFPDNDHIQRAPSMPIGLRPANRRPLADGDILFGGVPINDAHDWNDVQFTFALAFGEPEVLNCEPVLSTMARLIEESTRDIQALAALV